MRLTLVFNLLLYSYIYWRGAQVRGGGSGGGQVPGGPVSGRGPRHGDEPGLPAGQGGPPSGISSLELRSHVLKQKLSSESSNFQIRDEI